MAGPLKILYVERIDEYRARFMKDGNKGRLDSAIESAGHLRSHLAGLGHDVRFLESYDCVGDRDWSQSDLVVLHPPRNDGNLSDALIMTMKYPGTALLFVGRPDVIPDKEGERIIVSDEVVCLKRPYQIEDLRRAISIAIELSKP